jgi:EF-hand domain pair
MTSISTFGSNPSALLWELQRQFRANQATTGDAASAAGSTGTSAPATTTASDTPANNGVTGAGASNLGQTAMVVLIAFQEQSSGTSGAGSPATQNFFQSLDSDGDGQISQSELENAVTANGGSSSQADALFSKLDTNGDGSVSESELAAGLQQAHHGHHGHHHGGGGGGDGDANAASGATGGTDPLSSLLGGTTADGATSQVSTNPDGSSTTTLTYADGTTVTMTTPAPSNGTTSTNSTSDSTTANQTAQSPMEQLLATLIALQGGPSAPGQPPQPQPVAQAA